MPRLHVTPHLLRHVAAPPRDVPGDTVRAVLTAAFAAVPQARGYVLDDAGAVRHHVVIFVDGRQITDRAAQSDPVGPDAEVYVMQALSGG